MINTPLRILLTDDDEGDRLVFTEILEEMNIETVIQTANNGIELMDILAGPGSRLPHLLFLDLNMPHKDGITCLKEIRKNEKYDSISIAIYSTSSSQEVIDQTFRNGANIYITKPGNYEVLKRVLAKAVSETHLKQDTTFNKSNFVLKI